MKSLGKRHSLNINLGALQMNGTMAETQPRGYHGRLASTHGMSRSPEHRAWLHMRDRCLRPNTKHYERYGGRGITISEEWQSFEKFLSDMGPRPEGCWLERRRNNGSYSKDNCYWATPQQQARNKSTNVRVVYDGRVQTMSDWADEKGIPRNTLRNRLNSPRWTVKRALETPSAQAVK